MVVMMMIKVAVVVRMMMMMIVVASVYVFSSAEAFVSSPIKKKLCKESFINSWSKWRTIDQVYARLSKTASL